MSRRRFLASLACAGLGLASRDLLSATVDAAGAEVWLHARLRDLEAAAGGSLGTRLGVHILDTASGREYGYRAHERFPLFSSFKLLASALVLHRVDAGQESLARRIPYTRDDLVEWSPVTERHADGAGMRLADLCEAAVTTSDNTAANLILATFGGPAGLTAYARRLGDAVTRLDRNEPDLNDPHPTQPLDTTSPGAMTRSVQRVALGDALSAQSRRQLQRWLLDNTTGGRRLRAGLPADWRIGDKTGTGKTGANDIGVIWPPGRAPLVVSAYLADSAASAPEKDATLAGVGRLLGELPS